MPKERPLIWSSIILFKGQQRGFLLFAKDFLSHRCLFRIYTTVENHGFKKWVDVAISDYQRFLIGFNYEILPIGN